MAIVIKELAIKATIREECDPTKSGEESTQGPNSGNRRGDIEDIVSECVEHVMELLKEKSER